MLNNSTDAEKNETATEMSPFSSTTASFRLDPSVFSHNESSLSGNDFPIIFPVEESSTATEYPLPPTTSDISFTDGSVLIELIPSDPLVTTTEPDTTSIKTTEDPTTVMSSSSTLPVTTSTVKPTTTTSKTNQNVTSPKMKTVSESARGVSGLYDEVTSFGGNTIEVISTGRDGATKSIIISQPVRTSRFKRKASPHGKWIGYNDPPRRGKIVNQRSGSSLAEEASQWRRPMPVPAWLRPRPSLEEYREEGRLVVNTFKQNSHPDLFPSVQRQATTSKPLSPSFTTTPTG